ncbi:DNA polymerase LigD domain protein [Mycobacterium xenopi 3993]|nr:DNA polymerase LigD domain protein [Mycobacterium xenopi 3993]
MGRHGRDSWGLETLLDLADKLGPAEKPPKQARRGRDGRRVPTMPLIEIARTKTKDEAMAALDTWRERYPAAADRLQPADVLVDGMRGPARSGTGFGSTCSMCRPTSVPRRRN